MGLETEWQANSCMSFFEHYLFPAAYFLGGTIATLADLDVLMKQHVLLHLIYFSFQKCYSKIG
jgi:hypothetical protein